VFIPNTSTAARLLKSRWARARNLGSADICRVKRLVKMFPNPDDPDGDRRDSPRPAPRYLFD
jgi:hypothetical protein